MYFGFILKTPPPPPPPNLCQNQLFSIWNVCVCVCVYKSVNIQFSLTLTVSIHNVLMTIH